MIGRIGAEHDAIGLGRLGVASPPFQVEGALEGARLLGAEALGCGGAEEPESDHVPCTTHHAPHGITASRRK